MEAKTNYTAVGLMVVILIAGLLASGLWLSVGFDQKKYKKYLVYMHEAVSGLSLDSAVKYNGVQVGFVSKIELNQVNPQEVKLLLNIVENTPVTTGTTATLISQGITGNTFVGLSASSPDLTPLLKKPNEPYPVIPAKPSLLKQLDSVVKDVSENINVVSLRLKKILNTANTQNIKKSLANIEAFSEALAERKNDVSNILRDMAKVSANLPEITNELKNSINHLTLAISKASDNISSTMVSGKITLDKISQEAIPPTVILLRRINNIAANLEKVSAQIRQNPAVIIRGSAAPKPGPGE